jgi:hypothetical protein
MKIDFFGHSICGKRSGPDRPKTFVDMLVEHYQAGNQWIGFANCSEERLLYTMKKTKDIDVAIIFHSDPSFIYTPSFECDYHRLSEQQLNEKFIYDVPKFHPEWKKDNLFAQNDERIELDEETAKNAFLTYYNYFTTPEVNRNRHYGALIQIDQLCAAKNIKVIHCPKSRKDIPQWFKFTTGLVDWDIASMQNDGSKYSVSYNKVDNAISEEGNRIIYEKFVKYIDQLVNQSTNNG